MLCLKGLQVLFRVLVVFYHCFELFNVVHNSKGTFRQLHMILDQLGDTDDHQCDAIELLRSLPVVAGVLLGLLACLGEP